MMQADPVIVKIAKICHETNRAYCETLGDFSQKPWADCEAWQRESAMKGVLFHLNGEHTAAESHEAWMAEKVKDGWTWGEVKDAVAKTHPAMVEYERLPIEQRVKDSLFKGVVDAFKKK